MTPVDGCPVLVIGFVKHAQCTLGPLKRLCARLWFVEAFVRIKYLFQVVVFSFSLCLKYFPFGLFTWTSHHDWHQTALFAKFHHIQSSSVRQFLMRFLGRKQTLNAIIINFCALRGRYCYSWFT